MKAISIAILVLAGLVGCGSSSARPDNTIWLTLRGGAAGGRAAAEYVPADSTTAPGGGPEMDPSIAPDPNPLTGPDVFRWQVARAVFVANPRGQHELLAESAVGESGRPIRQVLFVRMLWEVHPARTGTDPTAVNAHVGYLVQTDPGGPNQQSIYYEGMGHVLTRRAGRFAWGGRGPVRFEVRRALLRLTRADREDPPDPFGAVELEGSVSAGTDPEAVELIGRMHELLSGLSAMEPAGPGGGVPRPPPLPVPPPPRAEPPAGGIGR